MVCLDTSFFIDLIRVNPKAVSKLQELSGDSIHTTIITLAELYRGAYDSEDVSREMSKVDSLLEGVNVLTLDNESAKKYGELHKQLRSNPIGDADLFIASIVVSKNETLLTNNVKHFKRIPSLMISSW